MPRQLEKRFGPLLEAAPDAIVILDDQDRIVAANRRAELLMGCSHAELVGQAYERFVMPQEREQTRMRAARLRAGASPLVAERTLLRPDGRQLHVEVTASLLREGWRKLALAILRDVSARRQAESELRAAQERLHHVLSSSPAVLYTLHVRGEELVPVWTSDNILEVLGYTATEISGESWWLERVHTDDRARVLEQARTLFTKGRVEREYRFRRPDGDYCWIRDEQRLLRDTAGDPVEVVGSWWNIADRKQAELRLRESEEQYHLLFERHPQPLWVFDRETLAFLAVNDAAVRRYGYSRDEFLAMTIKDIRPPEDLPRLLDVVQQAPQAGEFGTWRHRDKAGRILRVEIVSSPIRFQGREAELVLANDVTEKLALQAQLLQSQKLEALGQLAGGVAHDFNNLLSVITGCTDLLARELQPEHPGRRRVVEIARAAERAAGLTRQLLAFSRKQVLEPRVLDLNAVVAGVEPMLRRLIGEHIELVTSLHADPGCVKADPGQLEQVIVNLAVNARDAMPAGGSLVLETADVVLDERYARQQRDVAPGRYVLLAATDTGRGMDQATVARLFEPFFTTKPAGQGTGLGLATVFGIVKQSGGHVSVYSEPGHGTSFKVYLPRTTGVPEPTVEPAALVPAARAASETILVVEDAEPLRLLIGELLEDEGYRVISAENPEEALNLSALHGQPVDLLLTDVVMPGMSGPELAECVQALWPGVRVVYMSGYPDEAIGRHGALEPGTHFLQKPFTTAALMQKVRAVLEQAG